MGSLQFILKVNFGYAGAKPKQVRGAQDMFMKGDVIGCALDLTVPQISFSLNGNPVKGLFKDFNMDGLFFPVISMSACVRYVHKQGYAKSLSLCLNVYCSIQNCCSFREKISVFILGK